MKSWPLSILLFWSLVGLACAESPEEVVVRTAPGGDRPSDGGRPNDSSSTGRGAPSNTTDSGHAELAPDSIPPDAMAGDADPVPPMDAGAATPDAAAPSAVLGIWLSPAEVMALPMSGPAWNHLLATADRSPGTPDLSDQEQHNNVIVLAKALVFVRTGEEHYRTEVRQHCMDAIDTELGGRTLALGRELAAYVIAADLVGLAPDEDALFRAWLRRALSEELEDKTLRSTHEGRPNNWGTHAGASRVAAAIYLGDTEEVERAATVFRGWLGDRAAYAGFTYGDLSWQANPEAPVGINPRGATLRGVRVDGAMPEEMRRGCAFQVPPCHTGYAWEALQGAVVQAELLFRRGYDVYAWQDQALLRAVQFLYDIDQLHGGWWAEGDDTWLPYIINRRFGVSLPTAPDNSLGKNMAFAAWTHT